MKPVLILQNLSSDGPAYLARWLRLRGVPFEVVDSGAGQTAPETLAGYGALALLGGEMGANDDLPGLRRAEHLTRLAVQAGIPTLGHCLGGQLMAKALGGSVTVSPVPEIGWQPLRLAATPEAAAWFGTAVEHTVFQWHFDTFSLPPDAVLLGGSAACMHQAFAIGPHLGLQFHVELDEEKLKRWASEDSASHRAALSAHPATVQSGPAMLQQARLCLPGQQALADRLYARWLAGAAAA